MAFYGNDFASATLINSTEQILDGEMVAANTADFFRFVVTDATNRFTLKYRNIDGNSNTYTRLYDSTETQIDDYSNSSDAWEYTYIASLDLAPGTYYIELFRASGGDSNYELDFWLSEGGDITTLHTTVTGLEELSGQPVPIDAIGETHIEWDVSAIPYIGTDPTKILDSYSSGDWYYSNPENFVIPPNFRSPSIVMMGHRLGVSTPFIQGDAQRYKIHGTVKAEGVALADKMLRLYDRKTGQLMGETRSNALGQYTFPNPLWVDFKYYVIAFDDVDNPVLQAVIHDALIPIAQ